MTSPSSTLPVPVSERSSAVLIHLSPLLGLLLPSVGHLLGPLFAWLALRDRSAALDDQGKEALNFQLSVTLYGLIFSAVVTVLFVLGFLGSLGGLLAGFAGATADDPTPAFLGMFAFLGPYAVLFAILAPFLTLYSIFPFIVMLLAVVKVNSGESYRYPLTLRFLR